MTPSVRQLFIACALCAFATGQVRSAEAEHSTLTQKESKRTTEHLAMLDGRWSGPAWVIAPDGKRYELEQVETVCPALRGEVRVMEGRGSAGGLTRFHAVTVFEGKSDGSIAMRSYTPGRTGDYKVTLTGDGFEWGFATGNVSYRYRIAIKDDRWFEAGESKSGAQSEWKQIFGMELRRTTTLADLEGCITPIDLSAKGAAK